MGILVPYASTCTWSRIVMDARPVRTPPSSCFRCSSAVVIRLLTSANNPLRSLTSMVVVSNLRAVRRAGPFGSAARLCRDERADRFTHDGAAQIARRPQVDHDNRQAVVHA